jgi:glycosyltransferase involved in cell wall biosynthesis
MQILHVIKNFDFGGAENHLRELANSLDSSGNKVYIIGRRGRQQTRLNTNITFIPLPLHSLLAPVNLFLISYYIFRYKIQVIHAHQRHSMFLAALAGKIARTPVVLTVHGRSQYDLRSWISRKYADRIIFVSQFVLKASIRFPEIQKKVVYIPNSVPTAPIKAGENSSQISYISRIDEKHWEVILIMMQKILPRLVIDYPELTFNIIGEGSFLRKVKNEASRLNREFNKEICIVSGYQSNIMELIRNSVLVMGVGRVALEALACGTPVLSVNKNRMGAIVSVNNYPFYKANNFVAVGNNPPDAETLLLELQEFFSRLSYWQNESYLISKLIDEEFNSKIITAQIESLYKELVK